MAKKIEETESPKSLNATTKEMVTVKKEKAKTYTVKKLFRNKVTKAMQDKGDEIEVSDPERLQDLVDSGLIEE